MTCASTDRSVIPVTTADIRKRFLTFFATKEHQVVPSGSLVPANDKTILFTNAGMVQFKDVFLGQEKRTYVRAASSQRCLRTGGKHNDLENVGYTARHHTFFEMLGNFSFGDYFKRKAIEYAWEFLTEELQIPADKLWVTVYLDDDEAADIWINEIGVPKERVSRLGEKDNYWSMGDTGPCGPCSEIFYDHGSDVPGGPPGSKDDDLDRYIEIWNLVFMQFNSYADGRKEPLPKPSVDTGMGLERIAAVMQHVHSNYEIDLFQGLIKEAAKATKTKDLEHNSLKVIADHIRACSFLIFDGVLPSNEGRGYVLRRIMRRAIRHGYKLGQKDTFFYKLVKPLAKLMVDFYPELIASQNYIEDMVYKEELQFEKTFQNGMRLFENQTSDPALVMKYLREQFSIDHGIYTRVINGSFSIDGQFGYRENAIYGMDIFGENRNLQNLEDIQMKAEKLANDDYISYEKYFITAFKNESDFDLEIKNFINGWNLSNALKIELVKIRPSDLDKYKNLRAEVAFKLYDTYGFPLDLTLDAAREIGFTVDEVGFEQSMDEQRNRARAVTSFDVDYNADIDLKIKTKFAGYDSLEAKGKVKAILLGGEQVKAIAASETNNAILVLDNTSFYAEGGGQVGDIGQIEFTDKSGDGLFIVTDTKKQGDAFLHFGSLEKGELKVGAKVETKVDPTARNATIRNHSATHLMHSALREVLGEHVQQKGSLVEPARLRFDFSHYEQLTPEQVSEIENLVNEQIQLNLDAESKLMSFDDAIASGALAFFDEKYGDKVRVLKFGDYSTELCGGTHVSRVGDIGFFKITSESGIAAGVRRIEAVTGQGALQWAHETDALLSDLSAKLRTGKSSLAEKLSQTLDKQKSLEKELKQLKAQLAGAQSSDMLADAIEIKGIQVLAKQVTETDANALRDTVDQIKNKLGKAVVLLVAETDDGKVRLVAGVSKPESKQLKAGELVNLAAQAVGGKGGGRPDMAMAGGSNPDAISDALALVGPWVEEKLG